MANNSSKKSDKKKKKSAFNPHAAMQKNRKKIVSVVCGMLVMVMVAGAFSQIFMFI